MAAFKQILLTKQPNQLGLEGNLWKAISGRQSLEGNLWKAISGQQISGQQISGQAI